MTYPHKALYKNPDIFCSFIFAAGASNITVRMGVHDKEGLAEAEMTVDHIIPFNISDQR